MPATGCSPFTDPGGTTTLGWDDNGNMIAKGSAIYTFDPLDRLTEVISGTLTVEFSYDGDGVRLGKVVSGTATGYVQDIAAPLPVVLAESTGGQTQHYLYGNDLLALEDPAGVRLLPPGWSDSVRVLSDVIGRSAGNYDAFGAPRSNTEHMHQPFGFIGEQADLAGWPYLFANRYYDPTLGRFLSSDK